MMDILVVHFTKNSIYAHLSLPFPQFISRNNQNVVQINAHKCPFPLKSFILLRSQNLSRLLFGIFISPCCKLTFSGVQSTTFFYKCHDLCMLESYSFLLQNPNFLQHNLSWHITHTISYLLQTSSFILRKHFFVFLYTMVWSTVLLKIIPSTCSKLFKFRKYLGRRN